MANDIDFKFGDASQAPLDDYVPVTPGASPLADGPCRCVVVDADGTVDLTTKAGVQRNGVLVFKGYNPLVATHIRAAVGPTKVQAGY
jgi:hypothetical protein